MSVINQMLKDLEHRQHQNQDHNAQVAIPVTQQRRVPWGIILALFLTANFVAWYWLSQNQDPAPSSSIATQQSVAEPVNKPSAQASRQKTAQVVASTNKTDANSETKALVTAVTELLQQQKQVINKLSEQQRATKQPVSTKSKNDDILINKKTQVANKINSGIQQNHEPAAKKEVEPKAELSITRVKLTTAELVQQKLAEAELAIQENKPKQAEQAYADVLLLAPKHIMARQKLAALWFGRKAYQAALNTLSQGLALLPEAYQFRFMQARIYLAQGLNAKALEVLQQQAVTDDVDYLMMQAGLAQQLEQFNVAQTSYQQVTHISPKNAKAWLGYAIALDAQQQYSQALQAYQQTLSLAGLSAQNRQFAQQRSNELRN